MDKAGAELVGQDIGQRTGEKAVPGSLDGPVNPHAAKSTRPWIMLAYVLTIVLIGLPTWLATTSIYRAPLNYAEMMRLDAELESLVEIKVPVYIDVGDELPNLVRDAQAAVDVELSSRGMRNWRLELRQGLGTSSDYRLGLEPGPEDMLSISENSRYIQVVYTYQSMAEGNVYGLVASVLLDWVFAEEMSLVANYRNPAPSVVQYSPQYHLTFSLFVGDGQPMEWDIERALDEYFGPLRTVLAPVANFTVDAQVQYYSELANAPARICDDGGGGGNCSYSLDSEYLSTFVNYADWSLTSIHAYPTLHFILYIPSAQQSPMYIAESVSNSFLIPQWGGVKILPRAPASGKLPADDLLPVIDVFSSQLLSLLGAPATPKCVLFRVDALGRVSSLRALAQAASTLGSLHRLSQSLPNIAIPEPVLTNVQATLSAVNGALVALEIGNWTSAVRRSAAALLASEAAFFDRMMVQQVFFPDEHKVAIYLPLLGPIGMFFIIALVRALKEWRGIY